jgi:hypothetical protein
MTRIIFAFLVLTTSIGFSGEPDKTLHEKCLYPTIMITNENPKAVGTGVVIKSIKKDDKFHNYAFTCAHILIPVSQAPANPPANPPPPDATPAAFPETVAKVKAKDKYEVSIRIGIYENWSTLVGYKQYPLEILVIDRVKDIALVKFVTENSVHTADIDKDPKLYIGNKVCRVGCGMSEPFRLDYGEITSMKNSIGNMIKGTYRVNIPTIMGDSGGPVYHEEKLFGLAQAVRSLPDSLVPICHMVYVIPISRFYESEEIVGHLKD